MLYLIIYDISNNAIRARLAELLKDYGLERVQYSAFLGELKRHQLKSLITDIKKILITLPFSNDERVRNVQIYPIPQYSNKNKIEISFEGNKLTVSYGEQKKKDKVVISYQ